MGEWFVTFGTLRMASLRSVTIHPKLTTGVRIIILDLLFVL